MVKVIMGLKGSGKTKQMIELINSAVQEELGTVICIECGPKMTFDLHHKVRLIDVKDYDVTGYEYFKGFISGLYANNYDLSKVFIDSLCKVVPSEFNEETVSFLTWLNQFGEVHNIHFTVAISADVNLAPPEVQKFF